ncbi:MAG: heavy metal translocating P-type ATPase [Bacteroidota bacterium]
MNAETLLNVAGMDCANCSMTITRTLEKEGFKGVKVDFTSGEVRFEEVEKERVDEAVHAVNDLGYRVTGRSDIKKNGAHDHPEDPSSALPIQFILAVLLTLPLMGHMISSWSVLHDPWFQFALCTPVMMIGWMKFGRSAWKSISAGVPNMDVLITIGSTSAYLYSILMLLETMSVDHSRDTVLFFETAASIITLIMLGNLIEQRSVQKTTSAIKALKKLQPDKARKLSLKDGFETVQEVDAESLQIDDIIIISEGGRVPVDGYVVEGQGLFDESMMTGETLPVSHSSGQPLTGGTLCIGGSVRMKCEATITTSTLSKIISMVRDAQHDKPKIQRIGDRISAIFVPVVVGISVVTFASSIWIFDLTLKDSIMHAIAVLVISCPCAMGLATPTAVVVGIGRAAREGVLFKGGSTIEQLALAEVFVFDKTGTLTTGDFEIKEIRPVGVSMEDLVSVVYSLELESNHPIALSLIRIFSDQKPSIVKINWEKIQEDKGVGIHGWTTDGDLYSAGSHLLVKHLGIHDDHAIYVTRNNNLIGTIDLKDSIKYGAKNTVLELLKKGKRVILMSGDREERCMEIAHALGITEINSRLSPEGKLKAIKSISEIHRTVMVGDGINDAPALAAAGIGISMSGATDVAVQTAQVVLLHRNDMGSLTRAWKISKVTYRTILQNLFWAFIYNIIAIPFAAAGYLDPMFGAISMALSDVIVIGNSLRLNYRKIR